MARLAVERLQNASYRILSDAEFASACTGSRYVTTGRSVANLADSIRESSGPAEASDRLEEITAAHDGILASLGHVLHAVADVYDRLGGPADRHIADRMRYLAAHRLGPVEAELLHARAELADRSAPAPRTGPTSPPARPPTPPSTASGRPR
ncbi:hypothetical protein [Streptomyces sp. S1]|uniref:hypothetical protein n=1 Tax=Streptomyces sp. S1 TaxID=718288 RepID=UPI003D70C59C